jgi:SpoVK/Ycf46/Vps4 family AAA+-type ATPase
METDEFTKSHDRFGAYLLCQKVLARPRRCLVLFDEIEDVFPDSYHMFFGRSRQSDGKKALINGVLESNPVPAFWVSNEVAQIEPAYLRRFDYVLELPAPRPEVRRNILAKYVSELGVDEQWLDAIARNEHIPPAQIERAARVVTTMGAAGKGASTTSNLERIMNSSLAVMGLPRVTARARTSPLPYRLDVLNLDCDLDEVTRGLKRGGRGRLCLYGPSGTGKTAYGRYLAEQLERPLVLKRASDLLSKYVGDTEGNIAAMFAEARERDAVLMVDEADSFLRDRAGARYSWEVTLVNELLTQMEDFEGIFVASTNLMDAVDQASLRRFDLKIRFDYLKPEQAWALFCHVLKENGTRPSKKSLDTRRRLTQLRGLTPGDFATALTRFRITGQKINPSALVEALEQECAAKRLEDCRPIGFTATIR